MSKSEQKVVISRIDSSLDTTENSGVVTFKRESTSGVYDSFSDDTREQYLHDTEVEDLSSTSRVLEIDASENVKQIKRNIFPVCTLDFV